MTAPSSDARPVCVRRLETSCAEQQEQGSEGWQLHYAQMSAGQFHGRLVQAELGPVQVYEERMNTRIEQYYQAPSDALVFSFDMNEGSFYLLDGNTRNLWVTPEHYREIAVVIQLAALGPPSPDCPWEDLLLTPLKSGHGSLFSRWLSKWLGGIEQPDGEQAASLSRQLVDDCLYVLECSEAQRSSHQARHMAGHRRVVQRVFELVNAYPTEHFSALQLASAAGTSFQHLRQAFAECVGMPPSAWLRHHRLNLARQALLRLRPGQGTVAEVAMSYSFWHLGRFAESYRQLFLESPRETLASR
ncbi:helix-turn-helix domain-containing protein [Pseudomonas sp. HR96]|uniref:helix-turn-helix domain-containing protein n=1 Tax=Pseudomonas sp. HR96 TaxID=1027966 RepID=UPI002A75BACD|nr:helix-turn-helix domain-containing protein [Pseudomonas sp. HR96]WPO98063.1 helix-turn-helix domain-containing protein [Pseudomonas sp. HR96]